MRKIKNMAEILSKLHESDKKKVLNVLEENAKNDRKQKTLNKLRNKMRKINQLRILVDNMKIQKDEKEEKREKEKTKLSEDDINRIAYQFSADLYYKEKEPTSSLENLINNENEKNKIEDIADSMKKLDKEEQEKALLIINNNAVNEEQKEKVNKLSNLVKNLNNMKAFFGKMIKSQLNKEEKEKEKIQEEPIQGDFHSDEIAKITDSFWIDLDNNKKEKINKADDTINNFANIIKELKPEDKEKVVTLLKEKAQKENNNKDEINNLENKLNDLDDMKGEIESYKNSLIPYKENINLYPIEEKQNEIKIESIDAILKKENKVIIIEELEPMKLQKLTEDFCDELNEEEPKEEKSVKLRGKINKKEDEDIKVNNIANIVTKLNEENQKKVLDDLDKKVKNDNFRKLIQKIENINKIKNISKIIKERNSKRKEEQKLQEDNINTLYGENKEKELPEEKLENLANTFVEDIFEDNGKEKNKEDKENESEQNDNKDTINDIIKENKIKKA